MNRCGIPLKSGIARIGILCDDCAAKALAKQMREGRRFFIKGYSGPAACEACLQAETLEQMENQ